MSAYHDQVSSLLQELARKPCSYDEMAFMSQLTMSSVRSWVKSWREAGLVHIADWQKDSRGYPTIQLMAWGPGLADVPCPAMSVKERMSRYKGKQKEGVK